jgi:hypothetical protein
VSIRDVAIWLKPLSTLVMDNARLEPSSDVVA